METIRDNIRIHSSLRINIDTVPCIICVECRSNTNANLRSLSSVSCCICNIVQGWVKNRKVVIKGPRGVLTKDFKHLALDMEKVLSEFIK